MIDWNKQPYKAAIDFTGGDVNKAIEVIQLAIDLNSIGYIQTQDEKYNYV